MQLRSHVCRRAGAISHSRQLRHPRVAQPCWRSVVAAANQSQQQQQQQQVPFAAAAATAGSSQSLLEQQLSLLQQQVGVLTQLLQQSQQQNAALTSHLQLLTQELTAIKQQQLQPPQQTLQKDQQQPVEQPQFGAPAAAKQQQQQQADDLQEAPQADQQTATDQQILQQQEPLDELEQPQTTRITSHLEVQEAGAGGAAVQPGSAAHQVPYSPDPAAVQQLPALVQDATQPPPALAAAAAATGISEPVAADGSAVTAAEAVEGSAFAAAPAAPAAAASAELPSAEAEAATAASPGAAACKAVIALAAASLSSTRGAPAAAPVNVNLSQLGDLCWAAYQDLPDLSGQQLAALIAALAALQVTLAAPLGVRSLQDSNRAGITYGALVAAAASAAAAPARLAEMPPAAAGQLLAAVVRLGVRPDAGWTAAVTARLAGCLGQLDGQQQLPQVLGAAAALGVQAGQPWLQEACQAVLASYQLDPGSLTPAQLRLNTAGAAAALARSCAALAALGAAFPADLQAALLQAVPDQLLQQGLEPESAPAAAVAALLADGAVAISHCSSSSSSHGAGEELQLSAWSNRFASAVVGALPAATGHEVCRLAAALPGLGVNLADEQQLRALLLQQLEAKAADAPVLLLMRAITAVVAAGGRPTALLANALVVKTQKQLAAAAAVPSAAGSAGGSSSNGGDGGAPAVGGLPAGDLAAAAWSLAVSGQKPSPSWQQQLLQQLAGVASQLPVLSLYQLVAAGAKWGAKSFPPGSIIQAVQALTVQQLSQLSSEQVAVLAEQVVASGQLSLSEALTTVLPQPSPDSQAAAASQSLSGRPKAAAVVDKLWQEVTRVRKAAAAGAGNDGSASAGSSSSIIDAAVVQTAAAGLRGHDAAALASYLTPLDRWAAVLQTIAAHQQQQQQSWQAGATDFLALPDVGSWLQQVAAAVQQSPAETARAANGGPATLAALVALRLQVMPAWLAALRQDLDLHSSSKSSWFRSASAAAVARYLAALVELRQALTQLQTEAVCKHLPAKLQQLEAGEVVPLLQLLRAAAVADPAAASATGSAARRQHKRQQALVGQVVAAALPLLFAGGQSRLAPDDARQVVALLKQLDLNLSLSDSPSTGSSSSSSSSQDAAGVATAGAAAAAAKKGKGKRAAAASDARGSVGAAAALQFDELSALLQYAISAQQQQQQQDKGADDVLLGCLRLLPLVSSNAAALEPSLQQLLLMVVQHICGQEGRLHPAVAAECFCRLVQLAVLLDPQLAAGQSLPSRELSGVMSQLLGDAAADWAAVGPTELVAMPRQASLAQLVLPRLAQYVAAVQQQLEQQASSSRSSVAEVLEVSAAGAGPGMLLDAAVWLVMDEQPAVPGNTTYAGLHAFILHPHQDALSVQQQQLAGAADAAVDEEDHLWLPAGLFQAAWAALGRVAGSLTAGELAAAVHCYHMALPKQGAVTQRLPAWWSTAMSRLSQAREVAALPPSQQLALLCLCEDNRDEALLKAVLTGSQASLQRWSPTMLPFGLSVLASIAMDWEGDLPKQLLALAKTWQVAALTVLQPHLQQLPAGSFVQLLLGCSRFRLAAAPPGAADQQQQGLAVETDVDIVNSSVAASLQLVSDELDLLGTQELIDLLLAVGKVETASQTLGEAVTARLQPHLGSLPLEALMTALTALARWPLERRPRLSPDWADSFLVAAAGRLSHAEAALTQQQQEHDPQQELQAAAAGREAAPAVLSELLFTLGFLAVPPAPAFQAALHRCAAVQLPRFDAAQAVSYLHGLAMLKTVITTEAQMAARRTAAGTAAGAAGAGVGTIDLPFHYPAPLVDGLVMMAATGIRLEDSDDGLSVNSLRTLPQALRALSWPPDEQLAGAFTQQLQELMQIQEQMMQQCETQLQKVQQAKGSSGGGLGGGGGKRGKQKQQQQAAGDSDVQTQAMVQQIRQVQQQCKDNMTMIQGICADWDAVMQLPAQPPQQPGARRPSVLEALEDSSGISLELLRSAPAGVSSNSTRVLAEAGLVQNSSSSFNVDDLMAGLVAASGLDASSAAGTGAAAAAAAAAGGVFDDAAAAGLELDEMLLGMQQLVQNAAAGWQLDGADAGTDDDDDDFDDDGDDAQDVIDTTAVDLSKQ